MRWTPKKEEEIQLHTKRVVEKFAYVPILLTCGDMIWLEKYKELQSYEINWHLMQKGYFLHWRTCQTYQNENDRIEEFS